MKQANHFPLTCKHRNALFSSSSSPFEQIIIGRKEVGGRYFHAVIIGIRDESTTSIANHVLTDRAATCSSAFRHFCKSVQRVYY